MKKALTLTALVLFCFSSFAQTTVVLRPDTGTAKSSQITDYSTARNTNYGYYGVMAQMVWQNGPTWTMKCMVAFDLSSIPSNAIITNAALDLYADNPTTTFVGNPSTPMNGTNNAAYIRRITQNWNAYSVTWNNQPKDTTLNEVVLPTSVSDTQNYLGTNVTNLVQDMILYGNNGFMISPVATQPKNSMVFRSSKYPDANFRPQLTVTYTTPTINVNLGEDRTICDNSFIIFDPTIMGGIPPLTLAWSSTGDQLSCTTCKNPELTLTQNTTVILTVTDANNTISSDTIIYTPSGQVSTLGLSLTNTDISCTQPVGVTTADVTNGITPINYSWGDGNVSLGIASQTHNYSKAGNYVVSVRDSADCVHSAFAVIQNTGIMVTLSDTVHPNCVGDSSGLMKLYVSGGQSPYTYKWITGQTSDSIGGLIAGNYYVTVTDANQCSALFYHTLSPTHDIWAYYAYVNATNANCSNNGSIEATATGGLAPYSYLWSNNDSTAITKNLGAGTYNVIVTDSGGCQRKASAVIKYNCASIISGYGFVDTNSNCIKDTSEKPERFSFVIATKNGVSYYGTTKRDGKFTITVPDTGTYVLDAEIWGGVCADFAFCGNGNIVHLSTLGDSSLENNFTTTITPGFDLTIQGGWTNANPGFEKQYWLMPFNQSNTPFNGQAVLTFAYDSNLVYLTSAAPVPVHDADAHTLTWIVDSLPSPTWSWSDLRLNSFFHVPLSLDLNSRIYSNFTITPTSGDCDTTNNYIRISELVRGSFDPNEKDVEPANFIHPDDSILNYTIHFQNTGTDSTHFIKIRDTLSAHLDPVTVKNIASSHPYTTFDITEKGAMEWIFNPIRLVDSMTNPEGSKGFIKFTVEKKKGLPLGTIIENTAHIIFDYNEAIITNTVANTVAIMTHVPEAKNAANKVSVKAYPNPFNEYTRILVDGINSKYDFEVFDITGRLQRRITSIEAKQFDLQRENVPSGMYFYRILVSGRSVANGKLIIN